MYLISRTSSIQLHERCCKHAFDLFFFFLSFQFRSDKVRLERSGREGEESAVALCLCLHVWLRAAGHVTTQGVTDCCHSRLGLSVWACTRACFCIRVHLFFFFFFFVPEGVRVVKRRQESCLHLVTYSHFFQAPSHQTPSLLSSLPLFPSPIAPLPGRVAASPPTHSDTCHQLSCSSKEHFVWIIAHFLFAGLLSGLRWRFG